LSKDHKVLVQFLDSSTEKLPTLADSWVSHVHNPPLPTERWFFATWCTSCVNDHTAQPVTTDSARASQTEHEIPHSSKAAKLTPQITPTTLNVYNLQFTATETRCTRQQMV